MFHEPAQDHTFIGKRGDTPLSRGGPEIGGKLLVYRDVHEAVLIGLNRASGQPDERNVYLLDLPHIDPVALAQNICVVLEERAGIYPNNPVTYDGGPIEVHEDSMPILGITGDTKEQP